LLAFPLQPISGSEVSSLKSALNYWVSKSEKLGAQRGLGDYLDRIDRIGRFSQKEVRAATKGGGHGKAPANSEEQALSLPPIMLYRRAHQLSELVESRGASRNTALQVMEHIIQGSDCSNSELGPVGKDDAGTLEYLAVGELAAIFPRVFSVDIDARKEFVLSGRPKFAFRGSPAKEATRRAEDQADIWPHVLAASLRADGFGLVASGLEWNVIVALAWTRVQLAGLELAFWWRVHLLPSPIRFAAWSRDWAKFIQKLSERAESTSGGEDKASQRERVAYGWIYYQLYWMRKNPAEFSNSILGPLDAKVGPEAMEDWNKLLEFEPDPRFLKEERDDEKGTWKNRTLPLLARPELFLPPHVQDALLKDMARSKQVIDDLLLRRTRLITDASAAAQYTRNLTETPQSPKDVKALAASLNAEYQEFYGKPSPWVARVETDAAQAGATESQLGS